MPHYGGLEVERRCWSTLLDVAGAQVAGGAVPVTPTEKVIVPKVVVVDARASDERQGNISGRGRVRQADRTRGCSYSTGFEVVSVPA